MQKCTKTRSQKQCTKEGHAIYVIYDWKNIIYHELLLLNQTIVSRFIH